MDNYNRNIMLFCDDLKLVYNSGIFTSDALRIMAKQADKSFSDVLNRMADSLDKGNSFAQSIKEADYFDAFICPEDCTNIRATAKELQVSERWFVRFLVKAGFMYRCPAGTLMPYNNPKNEGLFRVKDFIRNGHKGAYTLITPKGKDLLRQLIPEAQATEV